MENLHGKCVVLGVTGGIAAYKMANVASALRKAGADVHVIMTENATQFITPLTFETLTNNRCVVDTFARDFKYEVTHISLAKTADLIMELTDKVVKEKHLTTIMVTHNLRYAVEYGDRLLMLHQGKAVMDYAGEEKKKIQIDDILGKFNEISIECGN